MFDFQRITIFAPVGIGAVIEPDSEIILRFAVDVPGSVTDFRTHTVVLFSRSLLAVAFAECGDFRSIVGGVVVLYFSGGGRRNGIFSVFFLL